MKFVRPRLRSLNAVGIAHHALIAVLLIAGFAGFGAYRVFQSSAAVQKVVKANGCQPGEEKVKDKCKVFTKEGKIQTDKVKADCAKYGLVFSGGQCQQQCVDKNKVTSKSGCVKKPAETAAVNCDKLNRKNADGKKCGPCKTDKFVDLTKSTTNDKCEPKAVCNDPNAPYNATVNACVNQAQAAQQVRAACDAKNLRYSAENNSCTSACKVGFQKQAGACVAKASPEQIRALCDQQRLKYDEKTKQCADECKNGFKFVKSICVEKNSPAEVQALCAEKFLKYDKEKKKCTSDCVKNFEKNKAGDCKAKEGANVTAQRCKADHLVYDKQTNRCLPGKCVTGFTFDAKKNKCVGNPNQTKQQVRATCQQQGFLYDPAANKCKEECRVGFKLVDKETTNADGSTATTKACEIDQTARQVKAACDALFLTYDKEANTCGDKCRQGYAKTEAGCVLNTEYTGALTQARCQALGRKWEVKTVPPQQVSEDGETQATPTPAVTGHCLAVCQEIGAKLVNTARDETSYCEGKDGTLSATTKLSAKECKDANRVYLSIAGVCAAKCLTGFGIRDGKCQQVESTEVDEDGDGVPDENGDGTTEQGGCLNGAQALEDGTCPEDTVTDDNDNTTDVIYSADITAEQCAQLGLTYDPAIKSKDGEGKEVTVAGCLTEKCSNDQAQLVRQENGVNYCEGFVQKIAKERCEEAGRTWNVAASACVIPYGEASEPGKRISGDGYCAEKGQTYVFLDDKGSAACTDATTIEKILAIVKYTGDPFVMVAETISAGFCNIQPGKHWNGDKCINESTTPVAYTATAVVACKSDDKSIRTIVSVTTDAPSDRQSIFTLGTPQGGGVAYSEPINPIEGYTIPVDAVLYWSVKDIFLGPWEVVLSPDESCPAEAPATEENAVVRAKLA